MDFIFINSLKKFKFLVKFVITQALKFLLNRIHTWKSLSMTNLASFFFFIIYLFCTIALAIRSNLHLCRLVRAAHAKGANIILIQVTALYFNHVVLISEYIYCFLCLHAPFHGRMHTGGIFEFASCFNLLAFLISYLLINSLFCPVTQKQLMYLLNSRF